MEEGGTVTGEAIDLPLVLLSHRGPVTFGREGDRRTTSKGSGGLVTALLGLAEHLSDAVWVCAAASDEDSVVSREAGDGDVDVVTSPVPHLAGDRAEGDDGPVITVRMIEMEPTAHERFYAVVSNPILWFIQHGLYGLTFSPVLTMAERIAFDEGYAAVNLIFADAVADEVVARGGRALVMIQDYHFYLVAAAGAGALPACAAQPLHPHPLARSGLLAGAASGHARTAAARAARQRCGRVPHAQRYARNFVTCCEELLGLEVDRDAMTIKVDGRTVLARHYPISVDPEGAGWRARHR